MVTNFNNFKILFMRNLIILFLFFIVVTGFRVYNNTDKALHEIEKPFCGIMNFEVENNTYSGCTVGMLYVTYPGMPTSFTVNYSSGQSGNVGSLNTGGPAGTLFSIRLTVTGGCDVIKLYSNGTLLQTQYGQPNSSIYFFYGVPSACATFKIVVE